MADAFEEIQRLLEPILKSMGLSLWDLVFQKHGPRWLLRIYIDKEDGGATLSDCEAVSRDLSAALDVEDVIDHAYTLEVSSPGLDRVLSQPGHFIRFTGSKARIKTYQPINGEKVIIGRLRGVNGNCVKVELDGVTMLEVPFDAIAKASLEVEF
jgi:ribosome maturation factor RimP